jgi:hypothetical protein
MHNFISNTLVSEKEPFILRWKLVTICTRYTIQNVEILYADILIPNHQVCHIIKITYISHSLNSINYSNAITI